MPAVGRAVSPNRLLLPGSRGPPITSPFRAIALLAERQAIEKWYDREDRVGMARVGWRGGGYHRRFHLFPNGFRSLSEAATPDA